MKAGKIWGQTELIHANGVLEFHRIEFKKDISCSKHKHKFKDRVSTKWKQNCQLDFSFNSKTYLSKKRQIVNHNQLCVLLRNKILVSMCFAEYSS